MESNATVNIFTVQFVQSIEREINVFIKEQGIVVPPLDILPVIYKIITSIKSNPKFEHILHDAVTIQDKILSILKKYLADVDSRTIENSLDVPSKINIETPVPEESKSRQALGLEKVLLLDSQDRLYTDSKSNDVCFKFQDSINVKDFNIDSVSFTTKLEINDPYVLVFIKQLPTTKFYDQVGGIGCYAKLLLDKVVNHNSMTTYNYKNPDMNIVNPNSISLDELTYKFIFPNAKLIPGLEVYDIEEINADTIELAAIKPDTIFVNDTLRLMSEDTTTNRTIEVTEVNTNDEKTTLKYISDSFDDTLYTALDCSKSKIVITMKFL